MRARPQCLPTLIGIPAPMGLMAQTSSHHVRLMRTSHAHPTFRTTLRAAAVAVGLLAGCVKTLARTDTPVNAPGTLDGRSPFLKVHLENGEVAVLSAWSVDTVARTDGAPAGARASRPSGV